MALLVVLAPAIADARSPIRHHRGPQLTAVQNGTSLSLTITNGGGDAVTLRHVNGLQYDRLRLVMLSGGKRETMWFATEREPMDYRSIVLEPGHSVTQAVELSAWKPFGPGTYELVVTWDAHDEPRPFVTATRLGWTIAGSPEPGLPEARVEVARPAEIEHRYRCPSAYQPHQPQAADAEHSRTIARALALALLAAAAVLARVMFRRSRSAPQAPNT